jgi:transcriptional regulator with XRE-family HTH domain
MLGKRLEELFEDSGKQQSALATYLNVSDPTVSQWKTDKRQPDLPTLKKISIFFDCSTDFLLGLTDIKKAHVDDAAANRIPPDLSPETYDIIQEAVQYALRKYGKTETVTGANSDKSG